MSQNIHTNETGGSNDSCLNTTIRTVSSGTCGVVGGVVTTAAGGSTGLAAGIGAAVCACVCFFTRPKYSEIAGSNGYRALPSQGSSKPQQTSASSNQATGAGNPTVPVVQPTPKQVFVPSEQSMSNGPSSK